MDARLATAPDMDLTTLFDVTDLIFPVRLRFIAYRSGGKFCSAYALHMVRSICIHLENAYVMTAAGVVSMIRAFRGNARSV